MIVIGASAGRGPFDCLPPPSGSSGCPSPNVAYGTAVTYSVALYPDPHRVLELPLVSGTVTFYDFGVPVATVPVSNQPPGASGFAAWSFTPDVGPHSVHATYSGDVTYPALVSGSCYVVVDAPPSPTTLPTNPVASSGSSGGRTTPPAVAAPPPPTTPDHAASLPAPVPATPSVTALPDLPPTLETAPTTSTAPRRRAATTDVPASLMVLTESDGGGGVAGVVRAAGGAMGVVLAGTVLWRRRRAAPSRPVERS
jgi:hypothetical protein